MLYAKEIILVGPRVLVESEDLPEKSAGGLVIPLDKRGDAYQLGKVLQVGKAEDGEKQKILDDISKDDILLYKKQFGDHFQCNSKKLTVLDSIHILCILKQ